MNGWQDKRGIRHVPATAPMSPSLAYIEFACGLRMIVDQAVFWSNTHPTCLGCILDRRLWDRWSLVE